MCGIESGSWHGRGAGLVRVASRENGGTVSENGTPGEFCCGNGVITRQGCGDKAVSSF